MHDPNDPDPSVMITIQKKFSAEFLDPSFLDMSDTYMLAMYPLTQQENGATVDSDTKKAGYGSRYSDRGTLLASTLKKFPTGWILRTFGGTGGGNSAYQSPTDPPAGDDTDPYTPESPYFANFEQINFGLMKCWLQTSVSAKSMGLGATPLTGQIVTSLDGLVDDIPFTCGPRFNDPITGVSMPVLNDDGTEAAGMKYQVTTDPAFTADAQGVHPWIKCCNPADFNGGTNHYQIAPTDASHIGTFKVYVTQLEPYDKTEFTVQVLAECGSPPTHANQADLTFSQGEASSDPAAGRTVPLVLPSSLSAFASCNYQYMTDSTGSDPVKFEISGVQMVVSAAASTANSVQTITKDIYVVYQGAKIVSSKFTVKVIVYPCSLTTATQGAMEADQYSQQNQAIVPFTFEHAACNSNWCGSPIAYSLTPSQKPSYLSIVGSDLRLWSQSAAELTTTPNTVATAELKGSLTKNGVAYSGLTTFQVTIKKTACKVESFNVETPISGDKIYLVGQDSSLSLTFAFSYLTPNAEPACTVSSSFILSVTQGGSNVSSPTWITQAAPTAVQSTPTGQKKVVDTAVLKIETTTRSDVKDYVVTITSTMQTTNGAGVIVPVTRSFNFNAKLQYPSPDCWSDQITTSTIADPADVELVAGASAVSTTLTQFTDDLACGDIQYQITTPNAAALALLPVSLQSIFTIAGASQQIDLSPTTDPTLLGTHVFTVEASLKDYPLVKANVKKQTTFSVKVTGSCGSAILDSTKLNQLASERIDWQLQTTSPVIWEQDDITDDISSNTPQTVGYVCGDRAYNLVIKKFERVFPALEFARQERTVDLLNPQLKAEVDVAKPKKFNLSFSGNPSPYTKYTYIGLYTVELTVSLKDYPLVKTAASMQINIMYPCDLNIGRPYGYWANSIANLEIYVGAKAKSFEGVFPLMKAEYAKFKYEKTEEQGILCGARSTVLEVYTMQDKKIDALAESLIFKTETEQGEMGTYSKFMMKATNDDQIGVHKFSIRPVYAAYPSYYADKDFKILVEVTVKQYDLHNASQPEWEDPIFAALDAELQFKLGEQVLLNYTPRDGKDPTLTKELTTELLLDSSQDPLMAAEIEKYTDEKSFKIEFTVLPEHLGKVIDLTFKVSSATSHIKKQITLTFIQEEVVQAPVEFIPQVKEKEVEKEKPKESGFEGVVIPVEGYKPKIGAPRTRKKKSNGQAVITVEFDQPMLFEDGWINKVNKSRKLKEEGLSVTYLNGFEGTAEQNKNQMNDWKVVSAEEKEMKILLAFQDPLWVSQNTRPCFVVINFGDGERFKGAEFGQNMTKNTVKRIQLEKQEPDDGPTRGLTTATKIIAGATVTLSIALPFLAIGLGQLKHMIEGLQIILYFPLMYVMAPSNLGILHKIVMLIVTFEIIPGNIYQDYLWYWTEEESLSARLEAVGLDSNIFMLSMGLPFYLFTVACVLLIVALIMQRCQKKKGDGDSSSDSDSESDKAEGEKSENDSDKKEEAPPKRQRKNRGCKIGKTRINCKDNESFRNGVMWNFFLLLFQQASLEISLSLMIGFQYVWEIESSNAQLANQSNSTALIVHKILLYAFTGMLVISLVAVIAIMVQSVETLQKIFPQCGSMYDEVRYEDCWFARFYPVWFMVKRIGMVAMVFQFKYTQGMVLTVLHLYLLEIGAVLVFKPFVNWYYTKLELYNSGVAYVFLLVIQIFSKQHPEDYSEEDKKIKVSEQALADADSELFLQPQVKQRFGWICVGLLVSYLVVHMTLFLQVVISDWIEKCKAKCCKTKQQQTVVPNFVEKPGELKPDEVAQTKAVKASLSRISEVYEDSQREVSPNKTNRLKANQISERALLSGVKTELYNRHSKVSKKKNLKRALDYTIPDSEHSDLEQQDLRYLLKVNLKKQGLEICEKEPPVPVISLFRAVAMQQDDSEIEVLQKCDKYIEGGGDTHELLLLPEESLPFHVLCQCYDIELQIYKAEFSQTEPHQFFFSPSEDRKVVRVEWQGDDLFNPIVPISGLKL